MSSKVNHEREHDREPPAMSKSELELQRQLQRRATSQASSHPPAEDRFHVSYRLPQSRVAVLPATSHTVVITQSDLADALIEPFLKGKTPTSMFETSGSR
jgi:hypothetical protein